MCEEVILLYSRLFTREGRRLYSVEVVKFPFLLDAVETSQQSEPYYSKSFKTDFWAHG